MKTSVSLAALLGLCACVPFGCSKRDVKPEPDPSESAPAEDADKKKKDDVRPPKDDKKKKQPDPKEAAPAEPTHRGRPYREWVAQLDGLDNPRAAADAAAELLAVAKWDYGGLCRYLPSFLVALKAEPRDAKDKFTYREIHSNVARVLGLIGPRAREAVPRLIELLKDRERGIGAAVMEAQAGIGPAAKDAIPALIAELKWSLQKGHGGRGPPAEALGRIGPAAKDAVPALIEALEGKGGTDGVAEAAEALGRIGPVSDKVVPALIAAISRPIGVKEGNAIARALAQMGAEAVPPLAAVLSRRDQGYHFAYFALAGIGQEAKGAMPALIADLKRKDSAGRDRRLAMEALGAIGPGAREAVPLLAGSLGERDPDVRSAAAGALRGIGPVAVPALFAAVTSQDETTRNVAVYALDPIEPDAAENLDFLTRTLKDRRDEDASLPAARQQAAWAAEFLGKLGPKASPAVPALEGALKDQKNTTIHLSAAEALARIAGPEAKAAAPELALALKRLRGASRARYAGALLRIEPANEQARTALLEVVKDARDRDAQEAAAKQLSQVSLGDAAKEAIPALAAAWAFDALAKIGPPAVPALTDAVKRRDMSSPKAAAALLRLDPKNADALAYFRTNLASNLRWSRPAAQELATLGAPARELVTALAAALKDGEPDDRDLYARALGAIGPEAKEASAALADALKDAYHGQRRALGEALKRIDPEAAKKLGVR
jgi:HEAT repeat protein